jgi:glutaredoxin
VKEFLSQHKIAFDERNVAMDPAALDELEKLGYATTPVTVINGAPVIGFDLPQLKALLGL